LAARGSVAAEGSAASAAPPGPRMLWRRGCNLIGDDHARVKDGTLSRGTDSPASPSSTHATPSTSSKPFPRWPRHSVRRTCDCCAARFPASSTSTTTASRSARPRSSAPDGTSSSSPRD
jgi:hypothetical protein